MPYIIKNFALTPEGERQRMEKRKKLVEAHRKGKLSNSFYGIDPHTGKKALLPSKLRKEGF